MHADEQAIRDVVALWLSATAAGDVDTVLNLMAEDVVFLVAGHAPMRGRATFETGLKGLLSHHKIESTCAIQEVQVSGDWAYCWNFLTVQVTPLTGGATLVRKGNVLSILRKQPDGRWRVTRDANMLALATT